MTIPICDCYCQSCLYEDDCTACEFIVDEPEFRERHPITNDEDEAAIAANRHTHDDPEQSARNCQACFGNIMHTHERTTP
jgi:hypothetical protein